MVPLPLLKINNSVLRNAQLRIYIENFLSPGDFGYILQRDSPLVIATDSSKAIFLAFAFFVKKTTLKIIL
jgi:hypothetical protein